jgi:hypothetical protein
MARLVGIDGLPIASEPHAYKMHRVKPVKPAKDIKISKTQAARAAELTRTGRVVKQGSLGNTVFRWPRDY